MNLTLMGLNKIKEDYLAAQTVFGKKNNRLCRNWLHRQWFNESVRGICKMYKRLRSQCSC